MPPKNEINERTRIPILWVASIVVACCFALGLFYQIRQDVSAIRKDLSTMVSRDQMREWRDNLQDENPTLKVPRISSADHVGKLVSK